MTENLLIPPRRKMIVTDIVGRGLFRVRWALNIYLPFRAALASHAFRKERDARKSAEMVEIAYRAGYTQGYADAISCEVKG